MWAGVRIKRHNEECQVILCELAHSYLQSWGQRELVQGALPGKVMLEDKR